MYVWLLVWVLLGAPARAADVTSPAIATAPASRTPEQWIDAVDAMAAKRSSMRYSATRITERASTRSEERWRFVVDGDRFRIDYFGDTARQVIFDGRYLLDYVPARRAALRFDLHALPADEAKRVIASVLEKVALPGQRLGRAEGVTWRIGDTTTYEDRPVVELLGTGADQGSLRYLIDTERHLALATEIRQDGQAVLRTELSDVREIVPGIWFPHRIEARMPYTGGDVRVSITLTKIGAVSDSPADLFRTELDPSIPIEERP